MTRKMKLASHKRLLTGSIFAEKLVYSGLRSKAKSLVVQDAQSRIFGGYERESRKIFIIPVQDRTEDTLLQCIKECILPGTTVISDCWKSYNCLNSEGFQHLTVNHSYNFVDPETGAYTQHIERVWREVRGNIPRYGIRSDHFIVYLSEFLFKRVHSRLERIEVFFDIIAEMYPPLIEDLSEKKPGTFGASTSTA
ncbi:uncharacterized protein LOC116850320 [Odontomachus brunneus]|uniref:uncharacterized protein LOC116850320 n=1 Tax=Odontomachus brunneus TaxID=486640 RepID=UPI0013F2A6EC|nr:uncharacterized protein LOC116850320 [Odontomachus brunneus]